MHAISGPVILEKKMYLSSICCLLNLPIKQRVEMSASL